MPQVIFLSKNSFNLQNSIFLIFKSLFIFFKASISALEFALFEQLLCFQHHSFQQSNLYFLVYLTRSQATTNVLLTRLQRPAHSKLQYSPTIV